MLNSTPGFDRHGNDYEADFTASWELDVRRVAAGGSRADYQASEAAAVATRAVAAQTADIYITIRGLQAG